MIVYGPYKRKDGRSIVIHYDDVLGTTRTQSYPRYLMEQHLGRELESWEQVDHINDDPTDNRIENLKLVEEVEHLSNHAKEWIKNNPGKQIRKDIGEEKTERFIKIFCEINGMNFEEVRKIEENKIKLTIENFEKVFKKIEIKVNFKK